MNNFDTIEDENGKEFYLINCSEVYNDEKVGNCLEDFEIIGRLGKGSFGNVFKVRSKINNKIYVMKMLDLNIMDQIKIRYSLNEAKFMERLSNEYITKYYNSFEKDKIIYIIMEFMNNGTIRNYINSFETLKIQIPEKIIWNFLLQCMSGLCYIHSKNIIHRDIKPENIFIDNNMRIKIGDLNTCAIINNNSDSMGFNGTRIGTEGYFSPEVEKCNRNCNRDYDLRADVYSMGIVFNELCFNLKIKDKKPSEINMNIKNEKEYMNIKYSKELMIILDLMTENIKEKRPNSSDILNMVKKEYDKRYGRNSSIDALIRCLYSFDSLTKHMLNQENINKPITNAYIKCLKSVRDKKIYPWIDSINNFRNILYKENYKLEEIKEVDPRIIFAIVLANLHKDLNSLDNNNDEDKNITISSKEKNTIKIEIFVKFLNNFTMKFNSYISNNFLGLKNKIKICHKCNLTTYLFQSYFLTIFDVEKIFLKNNFQSLNLDECFEYQNENIESKKYYCNKCTEKTIHFCRNYFYSLPNLLVISIQGRKSLKTLINIEETLDVSKYIESHSSARKYSLVGLIKKKICDNEEIFFSIIYIDDNWYICEGKNIKKINSFSDDDSSEDIIMLFYKAVK